MPREEEYKRLADFAELCTSSNVSSPPTSSASKFLPFAIRSRDSSWVAGCTKWNFKFRVTQFDSNGSHSRLEIERFHC